MALTSKTCRTDPRFVGDPIDVVTGANIDSPLDLMQRGPIPLRWVRYYSSARCKIQGSLGLGHSHDFDRILVRDLDGVRYQDPTGSVTGFEFVEVGASKTADGMRLTRTGRDTYSVATFGQPHQEFEFSQGSNKAVLGRLRQEKHSIEFRYTANGVLSDIRDSLGRLIRVISDPAGRVQRLEWIDDADNKAKKTLLAYEYDAAGNLVRGLDHYKTTFTFAYDAGNRVTRRTDRRGYAFHFRYDDQGRCVHARGEDGLLEFRLDYQPEARTTFVRRGDGGQWIYFYNDVGAITQITDPYGNATLFVQDALGRTAKEIDPNGNVTELLYDSTGRHYARIDPLGHKLPTLDEDPAPADPLSYELPQTTLEWELGNLLDGSTIQKPGKDDPLLATFSAAVVNTILGFSAHYDPTALAPAHGSTMTAFEFEDPQGILEETSPALGQRWQLDPNGNLAEYRDRDGSIYRFTYASWNLPYQEIDPLGHTATFVYAANLQLAKVIDAGGTEHRFVYDWKDRLTEIHYQGRLLEQFRYDRAENIIEKRDGTGRILVSWEIGFGNVDMVRQLAGGAIHRFQYDEAGNTVQAVTPEGEVVCAYDDESRRIKDHRDGLGIEHELDFGQCIATDYLGKFLVQYGVDDDGDQVITDPTGAVHRIVLSPNGLVMRQFANGSKELIQYDDEGRCRRKALLGRAEPEVWMRSYAYSREGDLLVVADTKRGVTKYEYDAAHRLAKEILPDSTRAFGYDAAGNLHIQPGLDRVQIDPGNRLSTANGELFTYDDRDNLIARVGSAGSCRYEYDALDRLVRADLNGQPWTAAYDAFGRRIRKTWGGQTTTYYWDNFRLMAELRHDGSLRLYVYPDEAALVPLIFVEYSSVDAPAEEGQRYYVFTNQVGSPIRVEDDAGQAAWTARLDPYGKAAIAPRATIDMPLRFPGHYFDAETGFHYNRFRYYSPEFGRYIQADPMGIEGGLNFFAYVDNPLIEVDLDGLKKPCPPAKPAPKKKPPKGKSPKKPPPKKPAPKKPPKQKPPKGGFVKVGDVGTFKDLTARAKKGDKLTPDHIPSNAANLKAALAEKKKQNGPNAKLTNQEKKDIRNNGTCIVVPEDLHKDGRTFGGKNTDKQSTEDAADLDAARRKDKAAHRENVSDGDRDAIDKGLKKV